MAPLIIIAALLCAVFAWSAVLVAVGAAKGKLSGEWVLWTFAPSPAGAVPAADATAGEGLEIPEQRQLKVQWRSLGFALAAVSALLATGCALVVSAALTTYPRNYEHSVWSALSDQYGVHAAVPGQGFEPGVPFPAMVAGKTVECSATPPTTVVCDGQMLNLAK
jgi:hypothetical protein